MECAELVAKLNREGYVRCIVLPNGQLAGIMPQLFTTGLCVGLDESCAYILTLERRLAQSQARVAELEKDADRLRRIRLAHKSGVVLSGDGTGYLNVLLEMDREDALKDRA